LAESEEPYWAVKSALSKLEIPKKELRVLEVGCGLGYLTYALIKEGYNATGLDISQNAIDEAIKTYGNYYICANVMDYTDQNKKLFDVVILTEVIEHVEEPIIFLKSLTNLLSKRGIIILTTPNKTIFPTNNIWKTDLPPIHLWWFSEDSMQYIANKINANIHFIDFTNYYKKKPGFCDVKKQTKIQEISHFFSSDGKVIETIISRNKLRSIIVKISFVKRVYNILNPNRYMCGKRGGNLGVVFTFDKSLDK